MSYLRSKIVEQAKSWIGCKESDGSHKAIIDVYNSYTPRARGYKVQYTDKWCATFVSACSIKCGYTDIIPPECSCKEMITLLKNINEWEESDSYTPSSGDIIFYDWDDTTGSTKDNTGTPDHVGIVEKVSGTTITVIEGNYSDEVKRRTMKVNGTYIRGYGLPSYTDAEETETEETAETATATTKKVATDGANSFKSSLAGTYTVTANWLNVRNGAGTSKSIMVAIPKGTSVKNYGYYTTVSGVKWLYIQFTYKDVQYTGFASSAYLSK